MKQILLGSLGLAFVIGLVPTVSQAADTLSVSESVELMAPPDKTWSVIKDFDGWGNWHPAIAKTDISKGGGNAKGTVRVLTTKNGAKLTEELVEHDDGSMTYSYRILESPLPVTDYLSTLKVDKTGAGSVVLWSSTFKAKPGTPDADAKKVITGIYRAGLDNLANVTK